MHGKRIEIVRVDPARWAFLHLPIAILAGIAVPVFYVRQESGVGLEFWMEMAIVMVILVPSTVAVVLGAAWLQATLLNLLLRMLRRGPILHVRSIDP